jgi:hypothetical protein
METSTTEVKVMKGLTRPCADLAELPSREGHRLAGIELALKLALSRYMLLADVVRHFAVEFDLFERGRLLASPEGALLNFPANRPVYPRTAPEGLY